MAAEFNFGHRLEFRPGEDDATFGQIPSRPGVFALRGEHVHDQPYLLRTADLRRRIRRLLEDPAAAPENAPSPGTPQPLPSKRLNLRDRARWIEWTETGSDFEGVLLLYRATHALFGEDEARKRLRLFPPFFLRLSLRKEHPRLLVTNKLSRRGLRESFGPFRSRAAASAAAEALGELFQLRRCNGDLSPHPEHPGCVYGEMGRCLAPCKLAAGPARYRQEADAAFAYLRTRGEALLSSLAAQRDAASEDMNFEQAAALHRQLEKAKTIAMAADPLIRLAAEVRAVVVQRAAPEAGISGSSDAAVFLFQAGHLVGPERLSTLGVRAVREQTAVGSSLFAQPLMLSAVPEGLSSDGLQQSTLSPEDRARACVARLESQVRALPEQDPGCRADATALLKRWYYRPEKQRKGEALLPGPDGAWPLRKLLNAAARVVLGPPGELPGVDREAAAAGKRAARPSIADEGPPAPQELATAAEPGFTSRRTRILHAGRPEVERVVPVLPKRPRP